MGKFVAFLASVGAAAAIVGTINSLGWLILVGGFTLLAGALAVCSTRPPR